MGERAQPSVAVVMATYNGSRFIVSQMESIRTQTVAPDRVIVRDDKSIDGTQRLIENYILEHSLSSWDFAENESNKGFTYNFLDAALETKEDVVFFSDQDDVWLERKIENSRRIYVDHEDCIAVLCGSSVIAENGVEAETIHVLSRKATTRPEGKIDLARQVSSMVASGHTLSVRRSFLDYMAPVIKSRGLTYDSPLGIVAAANDGLYSSGTIDVLHRMHSDNTSKPMYAAKDRIRYRGRHLEGRKFQLQVLEACRSEVARTANSELVKQYDLEIKARRRSIAAMEQRKVVPLLGGIFRRSPMKNERIEMANLIITLLDRG